MLRNETAPISAPSRDVPGPSSYWPLGQLAELQRDSTGMLERLVRTYGDIVRFRIFIWQNYLIAHPDHIKHVLQENPQNYHKGFLYEFLKPVVGEGLLTSEDEFWKRQRRIAQPAFHRKVLASLASAMTDETADMVERWREPAAAGKPIDVLAELMALTLEIVSRTMLSTDVAEETDAVRDSVVVLREHVAYRAFHVFTLPERVPTARNRRFHRALSTVDGIVYRMIDERRRDASEANDLLSTLLAARDEETGEGMTDKQLRDEVITVFLAGHETTANALSWALYLLSQHPDVEERLAGEVDAALAGRVPTLEDLHSLPYTRMVIEEALRLYPPAYAFARRAMGDDEIGGYRIPKDATVLLSPWVTHRHPEFWDQPERFDPERFTPERSAQRPRYAYFPFGGGPRQCIGNEFALMEAQLVLAMVAQAFRVRLLPGHAVIPEPAITLRPLGSLPMTLTARNK
ncbi:MAG: cytochrome P450 [Dehalococcoidia bacterium]